MIGLRGLLLAGSLCGLSGVILGAWGAHGLSAYLGHDNVESWSTAVDYQFFHALALLLLGLWVSAKPHLLKALSVCGMLFLLGIILFSGSIYGLTLGWGSWLGPITPLGGTCLIGGWVGVCYCAWRSGEATPTES